MHELCKLHALHVFPLVALKVLQQFGATVGFGLSENKKLAGAYRVPDRANKTL